jgi:hypothetical protein
VSTKLTVGPRPPHPPPKRIQLGSDAWVLLAETLADAVLPPPFRTEDGPTLDAEQREATQRALRDAGLLPGDSGDLLADLDPAVRESVLTHVHPRVTVAVSVGLGEAMRAARIAVLGELACALSREQRPVGDDQLDLGPVELSALLIDDVAKEVVRGFADIGGAPDGAPVRLDAAVSLAAVYALADGRIDLARAVLGRPEVPQPLTDLAAGLQAVARVEIASAVGTRILVALQVGDGWWTIGLSGEDVLLRPVGEPELVSEIAAGLVGALMSGAAS